MSGSGISNNKWRLFFAFWPTDSVRQAISDINRELTVRSGRVIPDMNLHLTLVFLGSVDESGVDRLIADIAPLKPENVTLQLDKLQWWRGPGVISLLPETVPASLQRLHGGLTEVATNHGIVVDRRHYRPHVTLRRKVIRRPRLSPFPPILWPLHEYCLVRSVTDRNGANYEVIWRNC